MKFMGWLIGYWVNDGLTINDWLIDYWISGWYIDLSIVQVIDGEGG